MSGESPWVADPKVRLYALTRGRTVPHLPLRMESQVEAVPGHGDEVRVPEEQELVALTRGAARSVVELAGTVSLPTNVVKVLLADLVQQGVLRMVHLHDEAEDGLMVLDAVLAGLRKDGVKAGAGHGR
ncbi:DUF742 domain-containing protein [Streptomyces amakusaensis]|uniref:DUF742 domain-containing protein n=1 Tax=Streptomyces amakusaensis TaxID=67271 RepID=A0ABW0AQX9_9ACTN